MLIIILSKAVKGILMFEQLYKSQCVVYIGFSFHFHSFFFPFSL